MKNYILSGLMALSIFIMPGFALANDDGLDDDSASVKTSNTFRLETRSKSTSTEARAQVRADIKANFSDDLIEKAKEHAGDEIDRRIDRLGTFSKHLDEMKRLSGENKTSILATINAQIASLTALKAKIEAESSTTTLREDIKSIKGSYRIYALVMPQAAVTAAAERVKALVAEMEDFGETLEDRIDAAGSVDASVTAALADYKAKIADAKIEAQAAIDTTANLKPDNGDQAVFEANLAALKAAKGKIQAAQQDIVAARKDAKTIVSAIKSKEVKASATTTTTVSP
ncbi:MAG: hypothetical protein WA014_01220 [Minisyncoccia bacterium]